MERMTTMADVPMSRNQRDLNFALGQLRHLYQQMLDGRVRDTAQAAKGLLGPAIEMIEKVRDRGDRE